MNERDGRQDIEWAPRVRKDKVRRLYEADARGLRDEELVDDVGITLLLRCRSILTVHQAQQRRVACPRCARQRRETFIVRVSRRGDPRDEQLNCPVCGWHLTWGEYLLSYKRKQLSAGGAVSAFERYVRDYPAARTYSQKMLAIDRLIHEFHYSLVDRPDQPCRPAGVNLIEGHVSDVLAFLDELSYGPQNTAGVDRGRQVWEETRARYETLAAEWRRRGQPETGGKR